MMNVENAGFINLANCKNDKIDDLLNYDILFYSTTRFTLAFVEAISKAYPKIKTLNVITDYNYLKEEFERENLCEQTFSNLGI